MISLTVRRKIMGIAVALIVLMMAVTAVLSMASVIQVGGQLDDIGDAIMAYWVLHLRTMLRKHRLDKLILRPPGEDWDSSRRLEQKERANV
ncbi:hypothetical protein [Bradyrhizobium sp. URHD0069]|uniref:hypothetical protein n=1 Tax=Bradyrhizobium sp. URHD0069 TaxID=1380355 RepID=UPI0004973A0A|nr:hypothetical protein [Bradyrhizobium sp. URHD0069]